MSSRIKLMIAVRLPTGLVERVDFIAKNIGTASRTAAIIDALEQWTTAKERSLREAGLTLPKRK